jgi:hypothetical protein
MQFRSSATMPSGRTMTKCDAILHHAYSISLLCIRPSLHAAIPCGAPAERQSPERAKHSPWLVACCQRAPLFLFLLSLPIHLVHAGTCPVHPGAQRSI